MGRYYNYGTPGLLNVGSYQIAGLPYLSGSEALATGNEDRHSFDPLAKSITVVNHGTHAIRVAFAPTGSMSTPATTHRARWWYLQDQESLNNFRYGTLGRLSTQITIYFDVFSFLRGEL